MRHTIPRPTETSNISERSFHRQKHTLYFVSSPLLLSTHSIIHGESFRASLECISKFITKRSLSDHALGVSYKFRIGCQYSLFNPTDFDNLTHLVPEVAYYHRWSPRSLLANDRSRA